MDDDGHVVIIEQPDGAMRDTPFRVARNGGAGRVRSHAEISKSASAPVRSGKFKKQRLAAAVCLHIAVALELVAGQTWAALQLGPRLWDPLPWWHGPRYTCQGHGLSGQSVVPPRLSGKSGCFGPSRLGYPSQDR